MKKIKIWCVLPLLALALSSTVGCSDKDDDSVKTDEMYAHFTFEENLQNMANRGQKVEGFKTSFVESYDGSKALMIPAEDDAMLVIDGGCIDKREMTISFWAKDLRDGHFFHAVNYNQGNPSFLFCQREKSEFFRFVCTQYHILNTRTGYLLNVPDLSGWHMITLVSDFNITQKSQATTLLYIDGEYYSKVKEDINRFSEKEGTADAKNYDHCSKFIIGGKLQLSKSYSINPTQIVIDNLRVYQNRRLSAKEVKKIYNLEKLKDI